MKVGGRAKGREGGGEPTAERGVVGQRPRGGWWAMLVYIVLMRVAMLVRVAMLMRVAPHAPRQRAPPACLASA